jgi:uncharacterized membrane protein YgdD (TMEM256/DUF423 family)
MPKNRLLLIAGLMGAAGVALGAFGAHALKAALLPQGTDSLWQTAVLYHLLHTVALLALSGRIAGTGERLPPMLTAAATCWIGGVILFSGSLYGLALGAPRALGPLTPIGGVLLVAGWLLVVKSGLRPSPGPKSP